jgi:HAD superfamily hydrolase (TIGR01509 family)
MAHNGLGLLMARDEPDGKTIEAVLFDMDGVVTKSMRAHFAAWKHVFDAFLQAQAEGRGEHFLPFSLQDYFSHVDGVPRFEGVRRFLASRGISLPEGPVDSLDWDTVHGLGNRKNERFRAWLAHNTVATYTDALRLIAVLKRHGIKVGVFSASRNAEQVLRSAGVIGLFDAKVDGIDTANLGLAPKPDPALLLETIKRLCTTPSRAIVVEDAVSGVEAGSAARFKHVIGIDREPLDEDSHARALRAAGADLVTRDLGDLLGLCSVGAHTERPQ